MSKLLSSHAVSALTAVMLAGTIVPASAEKTAYPLTIKNCGYTLTFEKAPERVVSVGQSSTEVLYMLGLADRVFGTSVWFSPVLKEFEGVNKNIPVLAQNDPSFESIIAKKPDLIANQYQWHIGPVGAVGKPEQFAELKIPVYTSPADCLGKNNAEGGDGTRNSPFSMDMVYQEIQELAAIFDVQDKGAKVIAELKSREETARKKVIDRGGKISGVFWFSSADLELDPYVAGKYGVPAYIMSTLGIANIVDSPDEWPTVGWETIAKANPTFIVLADMTRRRFPADDWNVKIKFLKSDPVTSLMPAVKDARLIVIDAQTMNPGVRTIMGIEAAAEAIEKSGAVK